jgi:heme/copper-type cytochrome/quinol oxidase subunit 2
VIHSLPSFVVHAQVVNDWGSCVVDGVPTLKCLEVVFGNILTMASAFIVLILFIMFVMGAFRYLTSFGNAEKVKKAQGTLKMALVGFIIFVSAFLILTIIQYLFIGDPNDKTNPNYPNVPNLFKFEIGTS